MTTDAVKVTYLDIPINRFEGVPYTEGGRVRTFGSYQQAYQYARDKGLPKELTAVQVTLPPDRVEAFERGE